MRQPLTSNMDAKTRNVARSPSPYNKLTIRVTVSQGFAPDRANSHRMVHLGPIMTTTG